MIHYCNHRLEYRRIWLTALLVILYLHRPLKGAEVWIGGSRAWGDWTTPGNEKQWTFLQNNVDGFYTNNFSMRPAESKTPTREERLAGMYRLLKNKKIFYETDLIHSSDDFDRQSIDLFLKQGFDYTGVTINYGTNEARNNIITREGRLPLYYMFGPWKGQGDINDPKDAELRLQISKYAGAAVDDPVTMWRGENGQKGTRSTVYSTIKWCHAHQQKFLFLLAPNDSGKTFLTEAQQLVRDLEDHNTSPDMWAVEFYGPQSFRDKLAVLPEAMPDGQPAATFSGVPYWLVHHLHDPKGWAHLQLSPSQPALVSDSKWEMGIDLTNRSNWLDLTPVVRMRPLATNGYHFRITLDEADVTNEMLSDGLVFNRKLRLMPGKTDKLILHITQDPHADAPRNLCAFDLFPNPADRERVNQTLLVSTDDSMSRLVH